MCVCDVRGLDICVVYVGSVRSCALVVRGVGVLVTRMWCAYGLCGSVGLAVSAMCARGLCICVV